MSNLIDNALNDLLDNVREATSRADKLLLLELATTLVSKMEMGPAPEDEKKFLVLQGVTNSKIKAIKGLRGCYSGLSLKKAKDLVEQSPEVPVVLCSKDHELAKAVTNVLRQNDCIVSMASVNDLRGYAQVRDLAQENYNPRISQMYR